MIYFAICLVVASGASPRYYRGGQDTDAAILLIASDSPGTMRRGGASVYLCDGTNDAAEFRSAIKALQGIRNQWDWTTDYGTAVLTSADFTCVWKDGSTYHAFYGKSSDIYHASSATGEGAWTETGTPVIARGASGRWDDNQVHVPNVWKEGSTWYMLYRGDAGSSVYGVGFASSSDPDTGWDKVGSSGTTEGRLIANTVPANGGAEDPTGLIKVSSTYYLFTNSAANERIILLWSTTDAPSTWDIDSSPQGFTLQQPEPLFTGSRFCPFVWKVSSTYYMMVCRYYCGREGVIELWSSSDARFLPEHRTFLGVVLYSADGVLDTPYIPTTDITRDTYADTGGWCYFSVGEDWDLYLTKSVDVTDYDVPLRGTVKCSPGNFEFNKPAQAAAAWMDLNYGITLDGQGATLKLADSQNMTFNQAIRLGDQSVLRRVILDGNDAGNTGNYSGICVSDGALVEDSVVEKFSLHGFRWCNQGRMRGVLSRQHGQDGANLDYQAVIRDSEFTGNTSHGVEIVGDGNQLLGITCNRNGAGGVYVTGDRNQIQGVLAENVTESFHIDGAQNIIGPALVKDSTGASAYGFYVGTAGTDNVFHHLVVRNCVGGSNRQNYLHNDRTTIDSCFFYNGDQSLNYAIYTNAAADASIIQNCYTDLDIGLVEDAGTSTAVERADGQSGAALTLKQISELVTVAVGSGADPVVESTGNLAPANSLILGVTFRITDAPGGGAAEIDVGRSGGGNLDEFIDGASCDVLTETGNSFANNDGLVTPVFNASAAKLTLTTDADVTGDQMQIRVVVFYYDITAPANNN